MQRTSLERYRSVTGGEDTKSPGPSYYPVPIPIHILYSMHKPSEKKMCFQNILQEVISGPRPSTSGPYF